MVLLLVFIPKDLVLLELDISLYIRHSLSNSPMWDLVCYLTGDRSGPDLVFLRRRWQSGASLPPSCLRLASCSFISVGLSHG